MSTRKILVLLVVITTSLQAQWQQFGPLGSAYAVATHGTALYFAIYNNGVYRTTNQGATWVDADSGITNLLVWALGSLQSNLLAGTQTGAAFRSTNNGVSWTNVGMVGVRGFALHRDTLFACQWSSAIVLQSTDSGATWAATGSLPGAIGGLWPIASNGSYLFVGGQSGGIRQSSNNGTTWEIANNGLTNTTVYSLAVVGSKLFAGTGGAGVFRSTNNGELWTASSSGLGNQTVYALLVKDSLLIAGTASAGVFVSRDSGTTWYSVNQGLTNLQVVALAADNQYLYAGTLGSGVSKRLISQVLTDVEPISQNAPFQFQLEQNYPNPFNPSTTIRFEVGGWGFVSLKVYDVLGREVATLVNDVKLPGSYQVQWDASNFASGVYFYRLSAGQFVQVRRLVLMK
ncbi:MAG TPA: T9SS type A sorting domain-containing protein [Bacteroidota bacterium]|nr:T9SS type A sorting domain-containing protein [Bacteroidota bacterium]